MVRLQRAQKRFSANRRNGIQRDVLCSGCGGVFSDIPDAHVFDDEECRFVHGSSCRNPECCNFGRHKPACYCSRCGDYDPFVDAMVSGNGLIVYCKACERDNRKGHALKSATLALVRVALVIALAVVASGWLRSFDFAGIDAHYQSLKEAN